MSARLSGYKFYDICLVIFVVCLLTANIIAVKMVSIGPLVVPAAVIIFPISYILGDVLTEVYGLAQARRAIWLGFAANIVMVAAIAVGQWLPGASFWDAQSAYERILGYTPRLLTASLVGYLAGGFSNAHVMAWMRKLTKGHLLWSRTIASTIVGEGLDSLAFIFIAFAGTMPTKALLTAIITQWVFKVTYEASVTPLTYGVVGALRRAEATPLYQKETSRHEVDARSVH